MMHLLLEIKQYAQAVALGTGMSVSDVAVWFAGAALAFFGREMYSFKREIQRWQAKIDTTLFGPEGHNGMNGAIKDHEARLRLLEADHNNAR